MVRKTMLLSAAAIAACNTLAHADPKVTLSNNAAYFRGDYGTGQNIDIYYDATSLELKQNRWKLKLTVPYLWVKNLPVGAQISSGSVVTGGGHTMTHDASGLGDIWLEGRYKVYRGSGLKPSVSPYMKVKFATASASSGLGTGRNDYEPGVMLQQVATPRLFPFAKVGYRFVGKPSGSRYRNIFTYKLGATYALSHKSFLTPLFSGQQSLVPENSNPADLILAWNYNVTPKGSGLQLYVDKGLSSGSADFGLGAGFNVVF
ncbi:MAG: transporter [Methylothermaceae bacterium]|nr:transporter [Methylothermaceae bacterium]